MVLHKALFMIAILATTTTTGCDREDDASDDSTETPTTPSAPVAANAPLDPASPAAPATPSITPLPASASMPPASSDATGAPTVVATSPLGGAVGVAINRSITATFSEALDPATIDASTFVLMQGNAPVSGTVTFLGRVATFEPDADLMVDSIYAATLTTGVKDLAGNALAAENSWSFTSGAVAALGPDPVALGTAGNFVILSKAGITNVATSAITGNIGTSPITGASIVGLDCVQVVGTVFEVDPTGPACGTVDSVYLTTAVSDMEIAYTDAAGRTTPDTTELGAGELGGLTLLAGLHKWSSNVTVSTDLKLSGGANDVWILQIAGDLTQANGIRVTLEGGALAKNVFWQVAGQVDIGTTAHVEGTILTQTNIAMKTGATMNGRALAQTAVTLQSNTIAAP